MSSLTAGRTLLRRLEVHGLSLSPVANSVLSMSAHRLARLHCLARLSRKGGGQVAPIAVEFGVGLQQARLVVLLPVDRPKNPFRLCWHSIRLLKAR